jgi:hypothetical protein
VARFTFAAMEPTATSSFAKRLRRFARWFFTFSPQAAAEPAPKPRRQSPSPMRHGRQRRAHAQQAGRVELFERKRP